VRECIGKPTERFHATSVIAPHDVLAIEEEERVVDEDSAERRR
jgi:hypothetical protein